MDKNEAEVILARLKDLRYDLQFAEMSKDRRSRDKKIRDARRAIADYAYFLPSDVKGFFYTEVDVNAMSYQYAEGDIGRCIMALEKWIIDHPDD